MEIKAVVMYRGAIAHYSITQENEGIFTAHLNRYDGRVDHHPPYKLTLIKGLGAWSGSIDDPTLLNNLGRVIEKKVNGADPLFPPSKKHKE